METFKPPGSATEVGIVCLRLGDMGVVIGIRRPRSERNSNIAVVLELGDG